MKQDKKTGTGFSFRPDQTFGKELLLRLKQKLFEDGMLCEEELLSLSAAGTEAGAGQFRCPVWKNDRGEGYFSCMNCTNRTCADHKG